VSMSNPYAVSSDIRVAALADSTERAEFIRRTYLHLGGAVAAFVLLEAVFMNTVGPVLLGMLGGNPWAPLLFVAAFMGVSWVARSWAQSDASPQLQYAGLGLYVVAEAAIFAPLLLVADGMSEPGESIPLMAGLITGVVFLGLTAITFMSRADFSWMGRMLWVAGLGAMAALLCGAIFGFSLGLWFSVAMVVLAAGYILYDTSNVLHHYRTNQHVAASLALFASVALLLWYVVRILIALRDE
jgi:FtsH-binding integral membrane protein